MPEPELTCIDIEPLLDAFHDKELDAAEQQLVEKHLPICLSCQANLNEIGRLVSLLNRLPKLSPKRDFAALMPNIPLNMSSNHSLPELNSEKNDWHSIQNIHLPKNETDSQAEAARQIRPLSNKVIWLAVSIAASACLLFIVAKFLLDSGTVEVGRQIASSVNHQNAIGLNSSLPPQTVAAKSEPLVARLAGGLVSTGVGSQQQIVPKQKQEALANNGSVVQAWSEEDAGQGGDIHIGSSTINSVADAAADESNWQPLADSTAQGKDESAHATSGEIAALSEIGHSTITEAIGISTDEDGLYDIRM